MVFKLPSTYEEFAQTLIQCVPKKYKQVDLLADDYKNKVNSLKLNEQAMRGQSERTKLHHFSSEFLQNSGLEF